MTPASKARINPIDSAFKVPGRLFILWAAAWLATATLLGTIASIKLHKPDFLAQSELLTFGRIYPAFLNALIYGWANNAIFAIGLWMMGRLCRSPIPQKYREILRVAGLFWNIGVVLGIGSILTGNTTSLELLEMPATVTPFLLVAYALIGVWGVVAFRSRTWDPVYVAQWYLLGAFFWFPWLYSAAQVLGVLAPARGVVQAIVGTWFAHSVVMLWLVPVALAAAYYFIPKMLGRPLQHYSLTTLGFWAFASLAGWVGTASLNGGPTPLWIGSVGVAASVLLLLPVLIIMLNYYLTLHGNYAQILAVPGGRFIVLGVGAFALFGLTIPIMALPEVSAVLELTYTRDAHFILGVYGFFTLIMLGAIECILLSQGDSKSKTAWVSRFGTRLHVLSTLLGLILVVVGLGTAGFIQGSELQALNAEGQPLYAFSDILKHTHLSLRWSSVGWVLLAFGQVTFFFRVLKQVPRV